MSLLYLALCTDGRQLLQQQQQQLAQQPASLATAPAAAAAAVPSSALGAALQDAPGPLASSGPLPAGITSFATKRKKNSNQAALIADAAPAASPVRSPLLFRLQEEGAL